MRALSKCSSHHVGRRLDPHTIFTFALFVLQNRSVKSERNARERSATRGLVRLPAHTQTPDLGHALAAAAGATDLALDRTREIGPWIRETTSTIAAATKRARRGTGAAHRTRLLQCPSTSTKRSVISVSFSDFSFCNVLFGCKPFCFLCHAGGLLTGFV